jgi:cellulose synthase (UDP-forming)
MADATRPDAGVRDARGRAAAGEARSFALAPAGPLRWLWMRTIAVATIAVSIGYLVWRVGWTIDGAALWLAVPFLALEVHGTVRFAMTVGELWDSDASVEPGPPSGPPLSVAVLIPTYDEGPEILLPTVAAALEIRGEHETWVLDDGHRPVVEAMAAQLGCGYISRPLNTHAKAGNLNHALKVVDTDLIAVLDADHVPEPEFLERTTPYFNDPDVALVQTPQEFYNVDSFVHADPGHHEELFFHRVIQAGKNRYGAAFWCGTGSVVRSAALRSVGGASTVSITEDLHTTVLLQRSGWRTVHHNEPLARGLAPRNYAEFSKQRWRWGAGAMQSFAVDFPLTTPGLSPGQRFAYFASFSSWFDSWRTFLYFVVPLAVLSTGASPIAAPLVPLLPIALAVAGAQLGVIRLLGRGSLRLWFAALNEFLRLPVNLSSTLVFLRPRSLGFVVTPKGRSESRRTRYRSPVLLRSMVAGSAVAALAGIAGAVGATPNAPDRAGVGAVAFAWLAVNAVVLVAAIRRITHSRYGSEQRGAARLAVPAVVRLAGRPTELLDLSMGGCRCRVAGDWSRTEGAGTELEIAFARSVVLRATVARVHEVEADGATSVVGLEFLADQWSALAVVALEMHRRGPRLRGVESGSAGSVVRAA